MSFDRVCREWRCKYTGDKATSESLEEISKLVDEYLPQIKAASKDATVNRLVCGACLDFKLMTTVSSLNRLCNDMVFVGCASAVVETRHSTLYMYVVQFHHYW